MLIAQLAQATQDARRYLADATLALDGLDQDSRRLRSDQLLDRLDIEQATMANTLARMQRDGLISRRRHPSDRRAQLVFLTQRGKALRDTAMTAASQTEDALFQGFRRFERELLLEYMRMLLANLGRDPRV